MRLNDSLRAELRQEVKAERFDITPEGVYFPRNGINVNGEYFARVNGGGWEKEGDNLVVNEGLVHVLNVALGATAKPAGYFFGAVLWQHDTGSQLDSSQLCRSGQ